MAKPKICGAKTKSREGVCQHPAGWGTDHHGSGRCRLHGGVVGKNHGAPKGSQNALKHGIYSRVLKDDDLDAAKAMQGSIDTELAIARLQLARLLEHQEQLEAPILEQIEEKTLAMPSDPDAEADKIRQRRAKDAKRCGEYYDPDDDDDVPPPASIESQPFERKRIYRSRDFQTEFARLTALIARLEAQLINMQIKHKELENLSKGGKGDDTAELTDTELDNEILQLAEGFAAQVPSDTGDC